MVEITSLRKIYFTPEESGEQRRQLELLFDRYDLDYQETRRKLVLRAFGKIDVDDPVLKKLETCRHKIAAEEWILENAACRGVSIMTMLRMMLEVDLRPEI